MTNRSEDVLVKLNVSDPLLNYTRDEFFKKIKDLLTGRVESAYVFGSVARGEHDASSDVDLILVTSTEKPFFERAKEFLDLHSISNGLDLLVYTPEEFAKLTAGTPLGFWGAVKREALKII